MDYSKLTYEQLQSLANELNQSSKSMENILNEVKGLLNRIGNTEAWQGTSATTVKAKFDELSAKFPEFTMATANCCTYIMSVVENYRNVDTTVSNI